MVERLVEFKIYALSVLSFVGSTMAAPDVPPSKMNLTPCNALQQGHLMQYLRLCCRNRANSRHPQCKSCHSLPIGRRFYSYYVQWSVHFETFPYFRTMTTIAPGCQDQLECLLHYNECPRFAAIFTNFRRHTGMRLRHELPLHDVITQTTCRGIQYGIVVVGTIGIFVYAHSHHHRNRDNPGNFEDCMEEPIHLMTASAPAYGPCISKLVSSKTPRRHFRG